MRTFLRLRGPLQAWSSTAEVRTKSTSDFPTRAGVLGLIASGRGLFRGSQEEQSFIKRSYGWKMTTYAYFPVVRLSTTWRSAPKTLWDYQTMGKPAKSLSHLIGSSQMSGATTKDHPGTPREKQYLMDADFVIEIGTALKEDAKYIKEAVLNPNWPPYLGRKCCVPSTPIFIAQFEEPQDRLRHGPDLIDLRYGTKLEETTTTAGTIELTDVPSSFHPANKKYAPRFVKRENR